MKGKRGTRPPRQIELNGLQIPLSAISSAFSKYTTPLLVLSDDPIYRVFIRGSGTLLRMEGGFYMACCYHQVKDVDFQQVGLLSDDDTIFTSGGIRHFIERGESDFHDLILFDFTEPCLENPKLQHRFFDFQEIPPYAPHTHTAFLQVAGYTSHHYVYELEEKNHLGLTKFIVPCSLERQPRDEALLVLKPSKPIDFHPDGMSGGSAFSVQFVDGRPKGFFAGIVVRAGRDDIFILKAGYVKWVAKRDQNVQ